MAVLIVIIIFVLIGLVVLVVGAPLRRAAAGAGGPATESAADRRADSADVVAQELEAAREAKYREIRDAEMDYRTGKLSEADYRLLDADLRAEALTILDRLQTLEEEREEQGER